MRAIKNVLNLFVRVVSELEIYLILGIIVLMLNELVLRNIIGTSFKGMTEMAGFLFLWLAFMGVIILYHQDRMIALDMFYAKTSGTTRTILWVLHKVVATALGCIMVVAFIGLYPYVSTEYYSSMPSFSKLWQYVPIAVTGGYLAIKSIVDLVERAHGGQSK